MVYDIREERVQKVHKYLKRFLHWVQNSVFQGELTDGEYNDMKSGLVDIIDSQEDFVLIYQTKTRKVIKEEKLGTEKNSMSFVL